MNAKTQLQSRPTREEQVKRALFRGQQLGLENPVYARSVQVLLGELLAADGRGGDLTAAALELETGRASGRILAREPGVAAGIAECTLLLRLAELTVRQRKDDGDAVQSDDVVLEIEGERGSLLWCERTALNVIQRMSGIATMTRRLQERVQRQNPETFIVATRKTPWGLLDKRAVHLGGGGTHRLGLSDAILIKNNHLALLGPREEEAAPVALEKAWALRQRAGFIEIEVRSARSAVIAAKTFRRLEERDSTSCPCLLLLDNMTPQQARATVEALQAERLRENVLVEVSGKISESNLDEYAACGADALSMGALTHSSRALDLSLRTH